jgi:hypothetical protein
VSCRVSLRRFRVARIALVTRCRRPRWETEKRVSSLILRSARRDPVSVSDASASRGSRL